MTDTDYLNLAEAALDHIEHTIDNSNADIEIERSGNVLTLEFEDKTKIIINLQPPMQEIWIAAKAGGFHYRYDGKEWRSKKEGTELFATLSKCILQQAQENISFNS